MAIPLDGVNDDPTDEQLVVITLARIRHELLRQMNDIPTVPKNEYVKLHESVPALYVRFRVVNPPGNKSPEVIVKVTVVVDVGGHPGHDAGPDDDPLELLGELLDPPQQGASHGIVLTVISSTPAH